MSLNRELLRRMVEAVREGREEDAFLLLPTHRLQARAREFILAEGGVAGARKLHVFSFYQFTSHLLDLAGTRREPVDDALRRFILRELVRMEAEGGRLQHFRALAESDGLAGALGRLIGELKLAGVTPGALEEAGRRSGRREPSFWETAHLYSLYQEFLKARALADREELLLLARAALEESPALGAGATILLEGFFDLTPVQADILQELARRAERVEFVLPAADERPELALAVERLRRLLAGAPVRCAAPDGEERRPPPLSHLAAQLYRLAPPAAEAHGAITLTRAPGPEREARQIARDVRRLIREEGVAPAEIAVVMADAARYGPLLHSALAAEGVPCDEADEQPLDRSPVVRNVLLCLEAALTLESGFDLLKMVRSAYLPGREAELGALRQVFRERGYLLSRTQWERRVRAALAREERRVAAEQAETGQSSRQTLLEGLQGAAGLLPALLDPLAAVPRRADLGGHLRAVERLIEQLGLEAAVLDPEVPAALRVRDWAALGAMREALAGLARAGDLLPEGTEVGLAQFLALLRAALSEARYPVAPAAPGGVALLTPTQARGLEFAHVFFAGLLDGVVPRPAREDWLLPDAVRQALNAQGLRLETSRERACWEKYLFHLAVTRATRGLHLSYSECDQAGRAQLGSPLLAEIKRLFASGLTERSVPRQDDASARPEERRLIGGASLRPQPFRQAARESLAARRGTAFRWSAGRFWEYNRCPFRYFLQRELLAPPVEGATEELTPLERGNLCHEILYRYYREAGEEALTRDPVTREAALRAIAGEVCERSPVRQLAPHPAFWEAAQERIVQQLLAVLTRDSDYFAATGLRPRYLEWSFGLQPSRQADPASVAEPLSLRVGDEVLTVVGKVDRVDVDGAGRFVVYDYKTGACPGWKDEYAGDSLQLRVYLRAVAELLLPAGRPAGAAYYSLKNGECEAKEGLWHREDAAAVNKFNRRRAGVFDAPSWEELLGGLEEAVWNVVRRIRDGEFPLAEDRKECYNCRFRAACRVDELWPEEGEEEP